VHRGVESGQDGGLSAISPRVWSRSRSIFTLPFEPDRRCTHKELTTCRRQVRAYIATPIAQKSYVCDTCTGGGSGRSEPPKGPCHIDSARSWGGSRNWRLGGDVVVGVTKSLVSATFQNHGLAGGHRQRPTPSPKDCRIACRCIHIQRSETRHEID
jgi:hypothetical protein